MRFVICTSCSRHVKDEERACPFCQASLDDANRAGNPGRAARNRLALLFGATTALMTGTAALEACGGTEQPTTSIDGGSSAIFYGAAIVDSGSDTGTFAVMYGPAMVDSGAKDAASDALSGDAGDGSTD